MALSYVWATVSATGASSGEIAVQFVPCSMSTIKAVVVLAAHKV